MRAAFDTVVPAIAVLTAAEAHHSTDRDILQTLASFSLQTADLAAARRWAQRLVDVAPDDAGARQQLEQIRRMRVLDRP